MHLNEALLHVESEWLDGERRDFARSLRISRGRAVDRAVSARRHPEDRGASVCVRTCGADDRLDRRPCRRDRRAAIAKRRSGDDDLSGCGAPRDGVGRRVDRAYAIAADGALANTIEPSTGASFDAACSDAAARCARCARGSTCGRRPSSSVAGPRRVRAKSAAALRCGASRMAHARDDFRGASAGVFGMGARLSCGGARVTVADSVAWPLTRASSAVERYVRLPEPRSAPNEWLDAIASEIGRGDIDLLLPTCEEVFYLSHGMARLPSSCRIFTSDFALLRTSASQGAFCSAHRGLAGGGAGNAAARDRCGCRRSLLRSRRAGCSSRRFRGSPPQR